MLQLQRGQIGILAHVQHRYPTVVAFDIPQVRQQRDAGQISQIPLVVFRISHVFDADLFGRLQFLCAEHAVLVFIKFGAHIGTQGFVREICLVDCHVRRSDANRAQQRETNQQTHQQLFHFLFFPPSGARPCPPASDAERRGRCALHRLRSVFLVSFIEPHRAWLCPFTLYSAGIRPFVTMITRFFECPCGASYKSSPETPFAKRRRKIGKTRQGPPRPLCPAPKDFVLWTPAGESTPSGKQAAIACRAGVTECLRLPAQ